MQSFSGDPQNQDIITIFESLENISPIESIDENDKNYKNMLQLLFTPYNTKISIFTYRSNLHYNSTRTR